MELNKAEFSKKDLWFAVSKTVVATFVLSGIFFRFIAVEDNQKELIQKMEDDAIEIIEKINYTNERIDKKTKRNEDGILILEKEIEKLKLPNTDQK